MLQLQQICAIFDEDVACILDLRQNQLVVMIHTGSRGLGHQTCTDYVRVMDAVMKKYDTILPDRELACAPFRSDEGQRYYHAMSAGANFAWTNRQIITHLVRGSWERVFGGDERAALQLVYDVAPFRCTSASKPLYVSFFPKLCATRAFPSGHSSVPEVYREVGQPVFIPGSMGTASCVLVGIEQAMHETFGSCYHGAGRRISRHAAYRTLAYQELQKQLDEKGIVIRAGSQREVIEKAPAAYSVD